MSPSPLAPTLKDNNISANNYDKNNSNPGAMTFYGKGSHSPNKYGMKQPFY